MILLVSGRNARAFTLGLLCLTSLVPIGMTQSLGPDFAGSYDVTVLGPAPGVPTSYGGVTFEPGDPNTLLLGGAAGSGAGAIYAVPVGRDAAGHVTSLNAATQLASAPNIDSGLAHGPAGVLFFSAYPTNSLGQLLPGSTAPDKVVDLSALGVAGSTGGAAFVPGGLPGAGRLKLSTFVANGWYDAEVVPDGTGTYDVVNVALTAALSGGPQGIEYVDASYPGFGVDSVLISEHVNAAVAAYEVDTNGDPLPGTRRPFLQGFFDPEGITADPLTGDLVFSTFGGPGSQIVLVSTAAGPLGTGYCGPAVPNSTGLPGTVSAFGSPAAAANDLTLTAEQLPPGHFGYFLASETQGFFNPPGSSGFICLAGSIARYNQPQNVGQGPTITIPLDLSAIPVNPPQAAQPGDTWNFQLWYRDFGNTNNFTDAVSVTLQ